MVRVTYNDYQQEFSGKAIPDALTFAGVLPEATATVRALTHGRSDDPHPAVAGAVKSAVCAVAEALYRHRSSTAPQVTAETVGNHSRSYAVIQQTAAEQEAEKRRLVRLYLAGTGLLYGGLH